MAPAPSRSEHAAPPPRSGRLATRSIAGAVYGIVVVFCLFLLWPAWIPLLVLAGVIAFLELASLARRAFHGTGRLLALVAGALYLAGGLGALAHLQFAWAGESSAIAPYFGRWALLALAVTWGADVAAYAVGTRFGTRRIAPRLSPGKTLEGTIAGLVAAALIAIAVGALYGLAPAGVAIVALLAGPAALAGDLIESALKRAARAKDSGGIIPGHGGLLDRIDSLLLVAPVVYLGFVVARSGMMGR